MAHYDFYAKKRVTSIGAWINRAATYHLARLCVQYGNFSKTAKTTVLEIGPGKGGFAESLANTASVDYKGYESDKLLFEELKSHGLTIVNATVPPIPEPPLSFDCVALINVLEHMPGLAAAEELINETNRVLRKNGTLFIVVPNHLDWGNDFFNLDYTHQFITTEIRCRQLLEDCGFRVKTVRYHYGCFFSGVGRIFNLLARTCRAIITLFLPRSFSRSDTVQKLGVLFAENIICVAEKQ
jgi:SAM-dependent methyltransferase